MHALEAGATIREAQQWLGRERLTTTIRYAYCVPTPEDLDAVLNPDGPPNSFFAVLRTHLWGRFLAPRGGG